MTEREMKTLLASQQGELDAVLMYKKLADTVKDLRDKETFLRLAADEGHHARVFAELTNKVLKPKKMLSVAVPLLYRIIGKKRLYPIIAKSEYGAVNTYKPVADCFPEIESVKNDEKRHGDTVMSLLGD